MAATIYDLAVERIVRAVKKGDFATLAGMGSAPRNRAKILEPRHRQPQADERVEPTPGFTAAMPRRRHRQHCRGDASAE